MVSRIATSERHDKQPNLNCRSSKQILACIAVACNRFSWKTGCCHPPSRCHSCASTNRVLDGATKSLFKPRSTCTWAIKPLQVRSANLNHQSYPNYHRLLELSKSLTTIASPHLTASQAFCWDLRASRRSRSQEQESIRSAAANRPRADSRNLKNGRWTSNNRLCRRAGSAAKPRENASEHSERMFTKPLIHSATVRRLWRRQTGACASRAFSFPSGSRCDQL